MRSLRGVLSDCDEVCGYKTKGKCNVNTWWWNSRVKNEIKKSKEAYKEVIKNPTDETIKYAGD